VGPGNAQCTSKKAQCLRIALNGSGVPGTTLAYLLQKRGHEPMQFEKTPTLLTGGYIIDFGAWAMTTLSGWASSQPCENAAT